MNLTVNGQAHKSDAVTLTALLEELGYKDATVATARNGEFVSATSRDVEQVEDGDKIEILAPMKGG
ncbi:MAG: sulfur carrier protein ThiS [Hyphomicrobiales bacterium]